MIRFTATILQFEEKGEKTGWSYIEISSEIAQKLKPGNKKSFRVKGRLDNYAFNAVALLPMGDGNFIMALNAGVRRALRKQKGATVKVFLEPDDNEVKPNIVFLDCLADEPRALAFFNTLAKSHKRYFANWIDSAKTESTRTRRIANAVNALAKGHGFGEMMRDLKKDRDDFLMG